MIVTEQQHYPSNNRNSNNSSIFEVDWEMLSQISRTSQNSEKANVYGDIKKLGDHVGKSTKTRSVTGDFLRGSVEREKAENYSDEETISFGSDRFDSILNTTSLTDGSCYSLHSEFNDLEDAILPIVPFDEEALDSRDSTNISDYKEGNNDISNQETAMKDIGLPIANDKHEFTGVRSISYAQLFFDPETKALVTLMEISHSTQPTQHGTSSRSQNGSSSRRNSLQRKRNQIRGAPLHCSSELLSKSDSDSSVCKTSVKRDGVFIEGCSPDQDEDDSPFQDETLSTECSSLSSVTFRRHDHSYSEDDCEDDWGFATSKHLYPPSQKRFSNEPIVYSNDRSMDQELWWLDKTNIGLYLLKDSDDPWDYGQSSSGGNACCGESIKKLLSASRRCISLPQLGESKWRSSTYHQRTMDVSNVFNQNNHNHKTKLEKMSYSVLNDM